LLQICRLFVGYLLLVLLQICRMFASIWPRVCIDLSLVGYWSLSSDLTIKIFIIRIKFLKTQIVDLKLDFAKYITLSNNTRLILQVGN
jgi:hypothetical protein